MPETTEQTTKPLRTWRPMAAWTAAILLALGLAWFVGAVVVPVWQVRSVLRQQKRELLSDEEVIRRLGGKAHAAHAIIFYYRLPNAPEPDELSIDFLLSETLPEGTEEIAKGLTTSSPAMKRCLVSALTGCTTASSGPTKGWQSATLVMDYRPTPAFAVPALTAMLSDSDIRVREYAITALKKMGPAAQESIPALENLLLKEETLFIRSDVIEALKKIRGEEPGK